MSNIVRIFRLVPALAGVLLLTSCSALKEHDQEPELESMRQGLKASAALGYCASVVAAAHNGLPLPANVNAEEGPGFIHVHIDADHPLPFNRGTGEIIIATLWGENGGVMSVLFTGIDILGGNREISGFWAVPLEIRPEERCIRAFYAREDIILGYGADTILSLSSSILDSKLRLLDKEAAEDVFVAVKQNFWIVDIGQNDTPANLSDDDITVYGGGQMAEAESESGGVVYHALIEARINYSLCKHNPVSGRALSQNFKAGGEPLIDLGNSLLRFHSECDGKAHVEFSSGKYLGYINKDISLNLE